MILDENKKLVDCCILVADSIKKAPDYEKTGKTYKFSYNYNVPVEKIEEAQKFIETVFDYFDQPCSRVYISGFAVLTNSSVWTKERITDQVKREIEKINMLLNESVSLKRK